MIGYYLCGSLGIQTRGLLQGNLQKEVSTFLKILILIRILVRTIRLTLDSGIDIDWLLSALAPFRNDETTFWTSSGLQDTSRLGYTYPDFNGLDMGNPDAVKNAISDRINELYGSTFSVRTAMVSSDVNNLTSVSHNSEPSPQLWSNQFINMTSLSVVSKPSPQFFSTEVTKMTSLSDDSALSPSLKQIVWDWTARIEFKMYELGTSFYVFIFLGEVPEDPEDWDISPSYVGTASAFVNGAAKRCANCTNQGDIALKQFVHLDDAIARLAPELGSLDPDVVEPYLKDALKWRVQKVLVYFILLYL